MVAESSRSRESTTRVSRSPQTGQRIRRSILQAPLWVVVLSDYTTRCGPVEDLGERHAAAARTVQRAWFCWRRFGSGLLRLNDVRDGTPAIAISPASTATATTKSTRP